MAVHTSIEIQAPIQKVFAVVTDLSGYSNWLPQNSAYKDTTDVSDSPVKLGTTYSESGPSGVKTGEVVEFEEPSKVTFSQTLKLNPAWLGVNVGIKVAVTLREGSPGVTVVERDVEVGYPLAFKPFSMVLNKAFAAEGSRTMEEMKKHVEGL
jgi:uncharacterized protein YndB with AHSA1/START domain